MTKSSLLISVKNIEEIKKIRKYADIIDLKNPNDGALGAWKINQLIKVTNIYQNKICLSATLGNIYNNEIIFKELFKFDKIGLEYIKIGIFHDSVNELENFLNSLRYKKIQTKLVAVFFAENKKIISYLKKNIGIFSNSKFNILLIDTLNKKSKGLLEIYTLEFLKSLVMSAKKNKIKIGLSGKIKKDQVLKLLNFKPSIIGLRSAVCEKFERHQEISTKFAKEISALF